jgi:hypothetical protein
VPAMSLRIGEHERRAWNSLRRKASSSGRRLDGVEASDTPSQCWARVGRPDRLLYFTKDAAFQWWFSLHGGKWEAPSEIAVCSHSGLPTQEACAYVRAHAAYFHRPLLFVGDLDPADLTTFLTLSIGSPGLKRPKGYRLRLGYLGIGDAMIDLCLKFLGKKSLDSICMPMTALEKEHFALVGKMIPSLRRIVGRNALELLHSGRKLEIEGAVSRSLQDRDFAKGLRRFFATALPRY